MQEDNELCWHHACLVVSTPKGCNAGPLTRLGADVVVAVRPVEVPGDGLSPGDALGGPLQVDGVLVQPAQQALHHTILHQLPGEAAQRERHRLSIASSRAAGPIHSHPCLTN